jgi:hypothetical protein
MTATILPVWASVYAVTISLTSMLAILAMGRITKRQRRVINIQHEAVIALSMGASCMWDALTPEQIRGLHRVGVEIGNGVPKWNDIKESADAVAFQMRTERTDES